MASLPLAPASAAAPCEDCLAGCCRGHALVIRGSDAARIARERGLPISAFAELAWCAPGEPASVALEPAEPQHRFRLQLKQVDEPLPGFTERCTFLATVGGRGRCTIYESRPAMCRTYPTSWRAGALTVAAGPFCPPGSWTLALLDAPAHAALHEEKRRLFALDEELAQLWNDRLVARGAGRTEEEYFTYLVDSWPPEREEPHPAPSPGSPLCGSPSPALVRAE